MQERDTYRVPEKYDVRVYWERIKFSLTGRKVDVLRGDGKGHVKGVQIKDGSVLYSNKDHLEAQYFLQKEDRIVKIPDSVLEQAVKKVVEVFS